MSRASTVFLSYSWESEEHSLQVLQLAETLELKGIPVIFDQFDPHPKKTWPKWMTDAIVEAEIALCICTAAYYERWHGRQEAGTGLGCQWEGTIITNVVAGDPTILTKFIPVQFSALNVAVIPEELRGNNRFCLTEFDTSDAEFERLYAILSNQELTPRPVRGEIEILSPKPRSIVPRSGAADAQLSKLGRTDFDQENRGRSAAPSSPVLRLSHLHFLERLAIDTHRKADAAFCREEYMLSATLYERADGIDGGKFHLSNAAQSYWFLKDTEKAIDTAKRALTRNPSDTCALTQLLAWTINDHGSRLTRIDEELAKHPSDHYLLRERAYLLHALGKTTDGIKVLQELWQVNPEPNVAGNLASIYEEEGDLDAAILWSREVIRVAPYAPNAWTNYGTRLARKKRIGLAIAAFQEALRIAPQYARAIWDIGACYAIMADGPRALTYLRQAALLNPELSTYLSESEFDSIRDTPEFLQFVSECTN